MVATGKTKAVATFLLKKSWVALLLLWAVQLGLLYVAVSEIEIPEKSVRPFLDFLKEEGLSCSFSDLKLHNLTVIRAKDVRIETVGRREPLLVLRRCSLKFAPAALISQKFIPQIVCADGVELYCPATNSASGNSERLVFDGILRASRSRGEICIESASFKSKLFAFSAFGSLPGTRDFFFPASEKSAPAAASAPAENTAHGNALSASPQPAAREKYVAQIARVAGTLSALFQYEAPGEIFVEARLENEGGNATGVELTAFCECADFSGFARVEEISARQKIAVLPGARTVARRGVFSADAKRAKVVWGENFSEKIYAEAKDIFLRTKIPDAVFSGEVALPGEVFARVGFLRVADFSHGKIDFQSALLAVSPQGGPATSRGNEGEGGAAAAALAFPRVFALRGNVFSGKMPVVLAGTVDVSEGGVAANFDTTISMDKSATDAFPQLRGLARQEDFRALEFVEFPEIRGNVDFSAGMKFERASFELFSGAMKCGENALNSLRLAGEISPTEVKIHRIRARGADFVANADVFVQYAPAIGDYRVRAWGTVDPSYIDGRLGWFWERIWRDLRPAPSKTRPRADIDVHGNWNNNWEDVFGAIAGENCYGNGVIVDKVCLRVYEDPLKIAAFDMRFERGEDLVLGTLQWNYAKEPVYHYRDFRFLFNGSIPPRDVLQIIGEGLPEALDELETAGAATATVSGMFSGDPAFYPERMLVNVAGKVPGAFSIFGIEGEDFEGKIFYDNGTVLVGSPFFAKSDAGTVRGTVRVVLPETGHSALGSKVDIALDLKNVRRSRLTKIFEEMGSRIAPEGVAGTEAVATATVVDAEKEAPPAFAAGTVESEKEDTSEIDATFAGTLIIPELKTLDATGKFSLSEKDLFELQFFGGFSRLLSSLYFNLTTFNMDRAEGSFTVRDGTVFLPDLRVFGESGEIEIRLDIALPNLELAGEAVFRNLRFTRIPVIGHLVKLGSASTELLPVKISGTVEQPEWSVSPSISRLWSSGEGEYGVAPEKKDPPADDADSEGESAAVAEPAAGVPAGDKKGN